MRRLFLAAPAMWLAFLTLGLTGCLTKDPVTGRTTLNMLSESQEIELGRQSHDAVIESFGLYEDKTWNEYVDKIGQEIAGISHRAHLDYHFYVVDSPVVNAFALPGGWVYFTRGILAHFNSEDELAGVMGHEVGHVVARHSAEQYSRQQLATIGLTVAVAASEDFRQYAGLAQAGLGLLFLKFSRSQESESDKLGVQYTTRLGYDSHKMAGFFRTIARLQGESGGVPTFLSTHPNPLSREQRVHELTDQYRAEGGYTARNNNAKDYLRRLEGMVYGEDPRNGFMEKDYFYHPRWRIQFKVPADWKMQRGGSRFQFVDPEQTAAILFQKPKQFMKAKEAAQKFIDQTGAVVGKRRSDRIGGFQAEVIDSTVGEGEQQLAVRSYFFEGGGHLYVGHGLSEPSKASEAGRIFNGSLGRFGKLTNRTALNKKPQRVRVKTAPRNGSLEANLRALGVADQERLEALATLNGKELKDPVARGALLKTVGK